MTETIYKMGLTDNELFPQSTWLNRPGRGVLRGPLSHPLGMFQHLSLGTGFDPRWEKPVFELDITNGSRPGDLELSDGVGEWLISQRAKQLLESLDPDAFVFLPVTTRLRDGNGEREGPGYFLCDVVRFVDALDESRSRVRVREEGGNRSVLMLYDDNCFRRSAIGRYKVFRLMYTPSMIACTEAVRTEWLQAGLTTNNLAFARLGEIDA